MKVNKKEIGKLVEKKELIKINVKEKNHIRIRFASLDKNIISS